MTASSGFINIHAVTRGRKRGDAENGWAYGDVWQAGAPEENPPQNDGVVYVEVVRCDTGRGYDDSRMIDLIAYLGSRGIRATYDSFSLGMEPAAIKTYVLKVEA